MRDSLKLRVGRDFLYLLICPTCSELFAILSPIPAAFVILVRKMEMEACGEVVCQTRPLAESLARFGDLSGTIPNSYGRGIASKGCDDVVHLNDR